MFVPAFFRSSAPSCTSSLPSARPSGVSPGSPDGGKSSDGVGDAVALPERDDGGTRDVRVSVRVPVASQEDMHGAASRAPAQVRAWSSLSC